VAGFSYLCGLVLAATFIRAASLKLARPEATAETFTGLGLAAPRALARAVPAVELAAAVALLAQPRAGGIVALALLGAFSAVLGSALRRGSPVPCACFGATSSDPVGPADLVRNLLLAALAAGAVTAPGPGWPGPGAVVALGAFVALGAVAIRTTRRRTTRA